MYTYAQLNENNMVEAISELSGLVDIPNMILLDENHEIDLFWRYIDGQWLPPLENPLESEPFISKDDIIMLALAEIYEKLEEA